MDNTPKTIYLQIGKRIREARERKNITQSELGARLASPVTATAISLYEGGERQPALDVIDDIAVKLGVTNEYLLHGASGLMEATPIHTALRADKNLKDNPKAQKQILDFIDFVKKQTNDN